MEKYGKPYAFQGKVPPAWNVAGGDKEVEEVVEEASMLLKNSGVLCSVRFVPCHALARSLRKCVH